MSQSPPFVFTLWLFYNLNVSVTFEFSIKKKLRSISTVFNLIPIIITQIPSNNLMTGGLSLVSNNLTTFLSLFIIWNFTRVCFTIWYGSWILPFVGFGYAGRMPYPTTPVPFCCGHQSFSSISPIRSATSFVSVMPVIFSASPQFNVKMKMAKYSEEN